MVSDLEVHWQQRHVCNCNNFVTFWISYPQQICLDRGKITGLDTGTNPGTSPGTCSSTGEWAVIIAARMDFFFNIKTQWLHKLIITKCECMSQWKGTLLFCFAILPAVPSCQSTGPHPELLPAVGLCTMVHGLLLPSANRHANAQPRARQDPRDFLSLEKQPSLNNQMMAGLFPL